MACLIKKSGGRASFSYSFIKAPPQLPYFSSPNPQVSPPLEVYSVLRLSAATRALRLCTNFQWEERESLTLTAKPKSWLLCDTSLKPSVWPRDYHVFTGSVPSYCPSFYQFQWQKEKILFVPLSQPLQRGREIKPTQIIYLLRTEGCVLKGKSGCC